MYPARHTYGNIPSIMYKSTWIPWGPNTGVAVILESVESENTRSECIKLEED